MPIITPHQSDGAPSNGGALSPTGDTNSTVLPQQRSEVTEPTRSVLEPEKASTISEPGQVPLTAPAAPKRRSKRLLGGVVILGLVGGAIFAGLTLLGDDDTSSVSTEAATITAVEATTGDLAEFVTVDGVLAYGSPSTYTSAVDGTITQIVGADELLTRGDVVYAVNEAPVVLFWGETPLYRPLQAGMVDGGDIKVLEANLSAMGFTADGALVVDEIFDAATTTAIQAFQEDIGLAVDGVLNPSSILLVNGPVVVSDVASPLGSVVRATSPVLSLQLTDQATTVLMPARDSAAAILEDRLITDVPRAGEAFSTGDVAFERNTEPVIVIIGDTDLDRVLFEGAEDGDDIEFLEATLLSLGFDAGGDLEVDDHFDAATAEALIDWEQDLGIDVEGDDDDGVFNPSDYVVLPADNRVLEVVAERGDRVDAGAVVFTVGVSTQTLTATIDGDDSSLIAVGDGVDVDFDDETIQGIIVSINDPVSSPQDPESETVDFEIALASAAPTSDSSSTDVEVQIVEQIATDVTLVPASALISLGDGTYAVEEVRGDTTVFVSVEPGDFSDGMVAVDGIEPGTLVVIP